MPGRAPSGTMIVDANIIVSATLGFRSGPYVSRLGTLLQLALSANGANEVRETVRRVTNGSDAAVATAEEYLSLCAIHPRSAYEVFVGEAQVSLRHAVASRNGSETDAHLLALAWLLGADIWSHDRDFAGTGWPSWSSANLMAALGAPVPHSTGH